MPTPSRRAFVGALSALVLPAATSTTGCAPKVAPRAPAEPTLPRGEVVTFEFASLDERPTSTEGTRGRVTVLLFLTTYGDPSILAARFLTKVYREHTPRFNAVAVFLERVENRPLARIFVDTLALPFPSAMGSDADIAGKGPFKGLDTVPSIVILDRLGREVFRKVGVAKPDEIVRVLRGAE